jgi:hypothetical protein
LARAFLLLLRSKISVLLRLLRSTAEAHNKN